VLRRVSGDREALTGIGLSLLALVAYLLTGPTGSGSDSFVPLADAFVHGRLSMAIDRSWLELVPRPDGSQYSPFPPVPALLILPVVAVMGSQAPSTELSSNVSCAVVGAVNVGLVYLLLRQIGVAARPRVLLTVAFAFTTHWWVAGMAGTHLFAQVTAVFFLLVALHLGLRRRWPMAAGLALGLAAGSRLPTGLALPLLAALYVVPGTRWRPSRAHLWLLAGIALPAMALAWYNVARFGSPFDFGYAHIPSGATGLVTDEPWFRHGLVSPLYIPRHLYAIFLQSFDWSDAAPFLIPSFTGLALTLSAPFLFWAVRARGWLTGVTWLSVGLVLLPDLMHGSWGFAQFGYRFVLDAVPLLILLLGWAYRERASRSLVAAVAIGVGVHAYGIVAINLLGAWG
jgi:hypothetical protein